MIRRDITFRVFVSSTFSDMHTERDYLNRFVFPELRSRCNKQGIEFIGVDLRWGVTKEEAEQHGALEICLNEIKKCNLFISLLGDRYGWIPPPDWIPREFFEEARQKTYLTDENVFLLDEWYRLDETVEPSVYRLCSYKIPSDIAEKLIHFWEMAKLPHAGDSITALEIIHGALESTNQETRAFFYFRKPGVHKHPHYPESLVPIFVEQDPHRMNKLTKLKELIRNRADGRTIIREYDADYAGLRIEPTYLPSDLGSYELETLKKGVIQPEDWPTFGYEVQKVIETHGIAILSGIEELGKQITEDIWAAIETQLEPSVGVSNQERFCHETFLRERTRLFLGRQDLLEFMLGYVANTDDKQPLVITGKSGCGKSALMAECARRCREKFPSALVIPYFIGAAPGSADLLISVRLLCEILSRECNFDYEFSSDPEKLKGEMRLFLKKAGAIRRIILFIDAINQLEPSNRSHELRWFPFNLPSGVRVIVSTLAGDCLDQLQEHVSDDHIIDVPVLPETDRQGLIQNQLANRGKKLTEGQIFRLLDTTARPDAGLPLYLLVALEELCLFGDHDALDYRIDGLPSTLSELFDQVLQRLEQDHTRDLTASILRLLAVSRSGLMELEILDVLAENGKEIPHLKWIQFYRSLEFYLRPMDETTGLGLIDFYHDKLRFAVYRRYLDMPSPEASVTSVYRLSHNQLADYFRGIVSDEGDPVEWHSNQPRGLTEFPYHLIEAGRQKELRGMLFDFGWLQAKLEAMDVNSLIADYDYLSDDSDLRIVQDAIRLSAHALARDKTQMTGQLLGRLLSFQESEIYSMLMRAREGKKGLWLRPLTASLTSPGGPLIRTFKDYYDASVNAISVTPDGRHVVSGSSDRTIKVWDLESGEECMTFEGHKGLIKTLVVTPDGRYVISGSSDCTLKIWDMESGEELRTLKGHYDWITSVSITPDGRRVVSASDDRTLKVWDLESGEELQTLLGHHGCVTAVSVTPDGRSVVSGSYDRTLKVWDLESGEEFRTLEGHKDYVSAISITPDGRHLISASLRTIKIWDLESGEELRTLEGHNDWINALSVTPDGRRVISGSDDMDIKIWDLESGKELRTIKAHTERVWALAVTPDGCHFISASMDGTFKLWDLESGEDWWSHRGHKDWVRVVLITPDGRRVVSTSDDRTLKVWDLESGEELRILEGHNKRIRALAVTPDSRRVISASDDRTLKVWDLESGKELRSLEGHIDQINAVSITPDGRRVISASDDRTLKEWDMESGEKIQTLSGHTKSVRALVVTPDSRCIISASDDNTLKVWDLESGEILRTLKDHTDWVMALAITPDGRHIISASYDNTLKVWDLETGEVLRTLKGHSDRVMALVVTSDGHRVISASYDRTLKVWDLESGEEIRTLEGHDDLIWALAVTSDGHRVISASYDRILKVWDLDSGEMITSFYGDGDFLTCSISSDGKTIVAGERSGSVHFLRLEGEYSKQILNTREDHFIKKLMLKRNKNKTHDFSAQMAQFDMYCAEQDYDKAASLLSEITYDYWLLHMDFRPIIDLHERLKGKISDPWLKEKFEGDLGTAYRIVGENQKAIEHHEQALAIAREIEDKREEIYQIGNLGFAYNNLGQFKKAIEHHEQALAMAREIGDKRLEIDQIGNLGDDYRSIEHFEKAIGYYEQALAIHREIGERRGEEYWLEVLGIAYIHLGQIEKAIEHYERALPAYRKIRNRRGEGNCLGDLGNAYSDLGQIGKAIKYYEEALTIFNEIDDQYGIFNGIISKAHVVAEQGEFDQAMELYHRGMAIADEIGNIQYQIEALLGLAGAHLYSGNLEAARSSVESARNYNYQKYNHNVLTLLGVIALIQGDKTSAKDAFETAIVAYNVLLGRSDKNYRALDAKGLALCGLALCEENTNYIPDAINAYKAARSITRGTGITRRSLKLFDELAKADAQGLLLEVRRAVEGAE